MSRPRLAFLSVVPLMLILAGCTSSSSEEEDNAATTSVVDLASGAADRAQERAEQAGKKLASLQPRVDAAVVDMLTVDFSRSLFE